MQVARQADGSYQATLCGHFTLTVAGDHPFRMRLLVLFLSLLDVPGLARGSRRTRDGRTPFVRQMQLAEWFGVPQPDISRWLQLLAGRALGQLAEPAQCRGADGRVGGAHCRGVRHLPDLERGAGVPAPAPARGGGDANPRCSRRSRKAAGAACSRPWHERYDLSGPALRLRDEWLVGQLLAQVRELLGRLEAGQALPAEVRTDAGRPDDPGRQKPGRLPPPPVKALPWLLRVEQVLFGHWRAGHGRPGALSRTAARTRSGARAPRRA